MYMYIYIFPIFVHLFIFGGFNIVYYFCLFLRKGVGIFFVFESVCVLYLHNCSTAALARTSSSSLPSFSPHCSAAEPCLTWLTKIPVPFPPTTVMSSARLDLCRVGVEGGVEDEDCGLKRRESFSAGSAPAQELPLTPLSAGLRSLNQPSAINLGAANLPLLSIFRTRGPSTCTGR